VPQFWEAHRSMNLLCLCCFHLYTAARETWKLKLILVIALTTDLYRYETFNGINSRWAISGHSNSFQEADDSLDGQEISYVGFKVPTALVMKSIIFWNITPCSPLSVNRRFGGTYRLPPAFTLVSYSGYLLDLEDGGDMFLRNVGWHSNDYTALYPRKWYSSRHGLFSWNLTFLYCVQNRPSLNFSLVHLRAATSSHPNSLSQFYYFYCI
jgi:hypothetical protein